MKAEAYIGKTFVDPNSIEAGEETPTKVRAGMTGRIIQIEGQNMFVHFFERDPTRPDEILLMWIPREMYRNIFIINQSRAQHQIVMYHNRYCDISVF